MMKTNIKILINEFIDFIKLRKCEGFVGPCSSHRARKIRMETKYIDESQNYMNLCSSCEEICSEYWAEKWSEYYHGLL
jgi:hypothetical protein